MRKNAFKFFKEIAAIYSLTTTCHYATCRELEHLIFMVCDTVIGGLCHTLQAGNPTQVGQLFLLLVSPNLKLTENKIII